MANTRSAKKQARQNQKRRLKNLARRSAIKTSVKKFNAAIEEGADTTSLKTLLSTIAAQLSRAKSKHVMHKNTASRKLSRLSKKLNEVSKETAAQK